MSGAYETYLFLHILGAIAWIGGDILVQVLALRVLRSADPGRRADFARDVEWLGMRVQTPASLAVIVFGVLLVIEGPWSFGDTWITLGLTAYALAAISGIAFFGPESGRIGKLIAEDAANPDIARRIDRILFWTRIQLVILILIVADMVYKPGF